MKKNLAIAIAALAAIILVIILAQFAGKAPEPETTPVTEEAVNIDKDKLAIISEIKDPAVLSDFSGTWLIFIHYTEATKSCEVSFDAQGQAITSGCPQTSNLTFTMDETGEILLQNDTMTMQGHPDENMTYLKGTAKIAGFSNPVPFSARKISVPAAGGPDKK